MGIVAIGQGFESAVGGYEKTVRTLEVNGVLVDVHEYRVGAVVIARGKRYSTFKKTADGALISDCPFGWDYPDLEAALLNEAAGMANAEFYIDITETPDFHEAAVDAARMNRMAYA
jgi:hypothetical protein